MARKNNLLKFQNITNGVMTGTNVLTSSVTSIAFLDDVGIEFVWTGSPVGNFQVQVSADHAQDSFGNVTVAGNWVPLLFTYWNGSSFVTSYNIPTSLASPYYIDLALLSAPWIRIQYTNISGSGVLQSFITAKQVGG